MSAEDEKCTINEELEDKIKEEINRSIEQEIPTEKTLVVTEETRKISAENEGKEESVNVPAVTSEDVVNSFKIEERDSVANSVKLEETASINSEENASTEKNFETISLTRSEDASKGNIQDTKEECEARIEETDNKQGRISLTESEISRKTDREEQNQIDSEVVPSNQNEERALVTKAEERIINEEKESSYEENERSTSEIRTTEERSLTREYKVETEHTQRTIKTTILTEELHTENGVQTITKSQEIHINGNEKEDENIEDTITRLLDDKLQNYITEEDRNEEFGQGPSIRDITESEGSVNSEVTEKVMEDRTVTFQETVENISSGDEERNGKSMFESRRQTRFERRNIEDSDEEEEEDHATILQQLRNGDTENDAEFKFGGKVQNSVEHKGRVFKTIQGV